MISQRGEQPQEMRRVTGRHAALEDCRDRAQAFDQHEIGLAAAKRGVLRECGDERRF